MEETKSKKGLSIAALIFGIISMLCCCMGFPFAIIGLILAIIALVKRSGGKGMAIAGIITSGITLVISTIVAVSLIPFAPYVEGFVELGENAEECIEEYEEYGVLPDVVQEMIDDGLMTEDDAKIFMDSFSTSYQQSVPAN
ncbi:MAG: hypothetical protein E7505_10515 [Ruminococcus sp.]|nr:hypothetical protein [Ruminococcus sp.]